MEPGPESHFMKHHDYLIAIIDDLFQQCNTWFDLFLSNRFFIYL